MSVNQGTKTQSLPTATIFAQQSVHQLTNEDFNLNTKDSITLKWDDCIIVLFYDEGPESKELVEIFAIAANQVSGPIFSACNIFLSKNVAKAFTNLNMTNSTYKPFALKGVPFIITYQQGYPIGFYNGDRQVQALVDFSLTLACRSDYYEPLQLPSGKTIDPKINISMAGWVEEKRRTSSIQFKSGEPVRRFATTSQATSTTQATPNSQSIQPEPNFQGGIPPPPTEPPPT